MKCKPGDLAVLIDSLLPENQGLIVKVLYRRSFGVWECESPYPVQTVDGITKIKTPQLVRRFAVDDHRLQPIRGNQQQKEIATEKKKDSTKKKEIV